MNRHVAIVGAGFIGRAWAIVFARAGFSVAVYDAVDTALAQCQRLLLENISDLAEHGLISEAPATVLARIRTETTLPAALKGACLVQECAYETLEIKRAVFAELDRHAAPDTILASSTSWLKASEFSEGLAGRARVLVARAITPRPRPSAASSAARATALMISSGSGVESTWATLGAVRPQPVSRCAVVVADILTRVPREDRRSGSLMQPEDPYPLDDEVDDSRRALGDHESDRQRPRPVGQCVDEHMVDADLHREGHRIQGHHREEPGPAGGGGESPAPVDEVRGDGSRHEADRLGQIELQPAHPVQEDIETEVDDRGESAGDEKTQHLRPQAQRRRWGGLGHRAQAYGHRRVPPDDEGRSALALQQRASHHRVPWRLSMTR